MSMLGAGYYANMTGGGAANPALDLLSSTAQGAYLNNNPYVDAMYAQASKAAGDQFSNYTMPSVNSAFSSAGRTGSQAQQQAFDTAQTNFGNTLNNLATNIYGTNYEAERARQLQAQQSMGSLYGQDITNQMTAAGQLGNMGLAQQQMKLSGVSGMSGNYQNDMANQLNAIGGLGGLYSTGAGQALNALSSAGGLYGTAMGQNLSALGQAGSLAGQSIAQQSSNLANAGNLYGQATGQQLSALGTAGNLYGQGVGQQISALGTAGNLYGTDVANQLNATGMINNAYQNAMSNDLAATQGLGSTYSTALESATCGIRSD